MITRPSHTPDPLAARRRAIAWLGFVVLLLSMLAPQLSLESAAAAQSLTTQQTECDDGFVLNERTGECEREPQRVSGQITTECPEGTERERETGACIPVTETPVPETETPVVTETATEVPVTETATMEATELPAPVGYVQAIKRACPEDFVPDATTTITELQNTCLDPIEGVLFHLLVGDVAHASVATDATGLSQLGSAPVGEIALAEDIPAGYGEPIVYCAEDYAFAPFEHSYTEADRQPLLDGTAIAWTLTADTLLQCYVYNIVADSSDGPGEITTQSEIEAGEGSTVTVIKHRCPLGVPENLTQDQYIGSCTALFEDIAFTLDHPGGSFPGTTGEDGQVTWPNVPAGGIDIQEDIPEGYKDPLVFCNWFDGEQVLQSSQVSAAGGLIELDVPVDATEIVCHVFNIQDENASSLTVTKWECPAGFDENVNDPETHCITPMDDVTFTLGDMEATTGEAGPGTALFMPVPSGGYDHSEILPPGIDRAIYGGCTVDVPLQGLIQVAFLDPPVAHLPFDEGYHWECTWYNVPEVETRVVVNKRICADDVDLVVTEDNSIQNVIDACPANGNGFEFSLDHAGGSSTEEITGGSIVWDGIPNGPITITEHIPPGYEEPVWYCSTNPYDEAGDLTNTFTWEQMNAPGGVLDATLDEPYGEIFSCWVFNTTGDDGDLIVHKWTCPPGYDVHAEGADPATDCTEAAADGITFRFGQPDLGAVAALQDTGDVIEGGVAFTSLEPGEWQLEEFAPDWVESAFIGSCTVNGALVPADPPLHEGFEWEIEIGSGQVVECHWYNVPEGTEENGVEIHKWQCPEGTEPGQPLDWYEANCVQQHDGVEFTVTSDIGIAVQETAGGTASFPGLPAGTVGIQETIPDGFGPPMVFCGVEGNPQHYPAPTGYWEYDFADDGLSETLVCLVFNIPGEPPSITIYKWTCPPGYDPDAAGADPKTDCTEATNGVDFQLGPSVGGPALLQTTGDMIDGGVVFDDLDPDVYKATEVVPEGIASVFVLECTGHIMGVLQPTPLSTDNVLDNIDLDAGEHLVCDWYNVPELDGGTLTVIKHICATETFVSEVDCEIYEGGATFDLLWWDGAAWQPVDTETTDGFGLIVWTGLDSGDYWLDEHDGAWCHITSTPAGDEDSFPVSDGEETVVEVYNCDTEWVPDDTPEKYPNTGVPPAGDAPAA